MTYEQALSIATRNFSDLLVDPPHKDHPMMLVVRKIKDGSPFSIHLPTSLSSDPDEILAQETESLVVSLTAARKNFGI